MYEFLVETNKYNISFQIYETVPSKTTLTRGNVREYTSDMVRIFKVLKCVLTKCGCVLSTSKNKIPSDLNVSNHYFYVL